MNKEAKQKLGVIVLFVVITLFISAYPIGADNHDEINYITDYDGNLVNASEPYLWKRTATTEIYKNPDGTMTRTIGQGTRYIDDKTRRFPVYVPWTSDFFPVINSTYKDYEYQLDTEYSDYEAYFQDDIKAGKGFRFEVNDYWFTYDLSGGKMQWAVENKTTPDWGKTKALGSILSSNPEITNNSVIYNNSFLNTDVVYEMRLDGVKENFVLSSFPSGVGDYLYLEYTGELQFDGNLTIWANGEIQTSKSFNTSGSIEFKDENGTIVFKMPSPTATDSAGNMTNLIYDIKPNGEKLSFGLKTPVSFLENAVYPVFIDPTITLQTADTENLDDAAFNDANPDDTSGTGITLTSLWSSVQVYEQLIKFDNVLNDVIISDATLNLYVDDNLLDDASEGWNISSHHYFNQSWLEETITWNIFYSDSNFNSTKTDDFKVFGGSGEPIGWINWNVTESLIISLNNNEENFSIFLNAHDRFGDPSSFDHFTFWSKEYTGDTSLRPILNVTYTQIVTIVTPTPSQIFTDDAPTTRFNITTTEAMDSCHWSEDSGVTNYSMTNTSVLNWTLLNTSMVDGVHTIIYSCNKTSDGTWVDSESVTFEVDSINVTVCRDLTVADRVYDLIGNITATDSSICINQKSDNITLDGNGFSINGESISSSGFTTAFRNDPKIINVTFNNFTSSGINIGKINSLNFSDINIINTPIGIEITDDISGTFTRIFVTSSSGFDLDAEKSDTFTVIDSIFDDVAIQNSGISGRSTPIFINTTHNSEIVDSGLFNSTLTVKWYFDSNVTDIFLSSLENAAINITNSTGGNIFSALTDSNGDITRTILTEYINNGGTTTFNGNYTVNTTKDLYIPNSTTYNLTISQNIFQVTVLNLIDVINPNISIISPSNNTNTSNNQLNITYSASDETALDSCWWTNDSGVTNITLPGCVNITTITWNDGTTNLIVYANDTSNNQNSSSVTFTIDTTPPSITIIEPQAINYANNDSIELNFSITDATIGVDTCKFRVDLISPALEAIGNTTITNCLNTTFALPGGDEDYTLTLFSNDTLGNEDSSQVTFGIRTNIPAIVLEFPSDNEFLNNGTNIFFNFTATDSDGLDTCILYTNTTGIWQQNFTWDNPTSGVQNFTTLSVSESNGNIWNVFCNDTLSNGGFAASNFTFSVDETFPNISINSIITAGGSQTIINNYSITDTNLDICFYSIFNSTGQIDGLNENVSITCGENLQNLATVSAFGSYNLTVYGRDLALNENSTTQSFSVSPTPPSSGGGSAVVIFGSELEATNFSITTRNFKNNIDVSLSKDSVKSRTKDFIIVNEGRDPIEVDIFCETEDLNESSFIAEGITICDFVKLSDETAIISAIEENRFEGNFELLTPPNSKIGDEYFFNIFATRKTDEGTKFSKLSVSARVSSLAVMGKWSFLPGQEDKPINERNSYPVWVASLVISFLLFIGTIFLFRLGNLVLTGFFVGLGILITSFITFIIIL